MLSFSTGAFQSGGAVVSNWRFVPVWSPGSTKLQFARIHGTKGSYQEDLWTANADGTGLNQVTDTPGANFLEEPAGWGTHPLAT